VTGRAWRELAAAGGRPRRDATRDHGAHPGELRVAQLAVAGLASRQIAHALFDTQRAAENQLTSTYFKLRVTSRGALAATLAPAAARSPGSGPATAPAASRLHPRARKNCGAHRDAPGRAAGRR
jgi:DNA-binding CsgD family transcriptional regulator